MGVGIPETNPLISHGVGIIPGTTPDLRVVHDQCLYRVQKPFPLAISYRVRTQLKFYMVVMEWIDI